MIRLPTAQKGTNRPINGGANFTKLLSERAVTNAPLVARVYDRANFLSKNNTKNYCQG